MATTQDFDERVEAAIKKVLLEEFSHMKISSVNDIAGHGARETALRFRARSKEDYHGVRALHFLDLPRELRDQIYEYAVVPTAYDGRTTMAIPVGLDTLWIGSLAYGPYACGLTFGPSAKQPAITRVSSQLRSETLPLFYQSNQFVFTMEVHKFPRKKGQQSPDEFAAWLKAIGPENVAHLRQLVKVEDFPGRRRDPMTLDDFEQMYKVRVPREVVVPYKVAKREPERRFLAATSRNLLPRG